MKYLLCAIHVNIFNNLLPINESISFLYSLKILFLIVSYPVRQECSNIDISIWGLDLIRKKCNLVKLAICYYHYILSLLCFIAQLYSNFWHTPSECLPRFGRHLYQKLLYSSWSNKQSEDNINVSLASKIAI